MAIYLAESGVRVMCLTPSAERFEALAVNRNPNTSPVLPLSYSLTIFYFANIEYNFLGKVALLPLFLTTNKYLSSG